MNQEWTQLWTGFGRLASPISAHCRAHADCPDPWQPVRPVSSGPREVPARRTALRRGIERYGQAAPGRVSSPAMHPHPDLPPDGGRCIGNVRRDFAEWHLGRPRYALWALDVDVPAVRQRMGAAQEHLAGLLLDGYQRQPHITVSLCGFPSAAPRHADDFGAAALHAHVAALRRAWPEPFDIEIGALASFASAPYLAVSDAGGRIAALRACFAAGDHNHPDGEYVPHVTVGLYADAWPMAGVRPRLDAFAAGAPLRLRIGRIGLLGYAAADIGGPLARIADYDFADGVLHWHAPPPFAHAAAAAFDTL